MTITNVTKKPQFIEKKYKKKYKEPYKEVVEFGQEWLKGRGVLWIDHPLKNKIPKWATICGNCKNDETKIIAAHWEIDIHTGNPFWDCEVYCDKCKRYTQYSLARDEKIE
ncbi:MAG: hypothetical protein ACTSRG_12500 [Candidatus Helarchaeota archaeon]